MVVRTLPIRVGGNSGPYYSDQIETSWEELNLPPEYTTVTKRVRRVFTFSNQQFKEALLANRPDYVAVSHLDYIADPDNFIERLRHVAMDIGQYPVFILGTGPDLKQWKFRE
jgi:adenylosuccinate synthase